MCWAHMRRCVDHHLHLVDKDDREDILDDIDFIQQSPSTEVYDCAIKLFKNKWSEYEGFLEYMEKEWLGDKNGWYEGYVLR